jgi:putative ABC transport system substrate-binding protein
MNNRRKLLVALSASVLSRPFASLAQQATPHRVGVLSTASATDSPNIQAFFHGMNSLGWIDGQNISVDYRYAEGNIDRLPALARDLVERKVDVILTLSGTATRAVKQATAAIPIVFITVIDPVSMGFIKALAQPGANITGIMGLGSELIAKRLQIMREILPNISRTAVATTGEPTDDIQYAMVLSAAQELGIHLLRIKVRSSSDLPQALAMLRRWHADSMYVLDASLNFYNRKLLADFAIKNKVPMAAGAFPYAEAGGLIGYGSNYEELSRSAATLVDKILHGIKPGDIPVKQSATVELTINMRTAKSLGIPIPQSILVRADKVIE